MSVLSGKIAPADESQLRDQQKIAEEAWMKIGSLEPANQQQAAEDWAAEHGHLFFWCCGSPVFGGAAVEEYYEASKHYRRGDLGGSKVYWERFTP